MEKLLTVAEAMPPTRGKGCFVMPRIAAAKDDRGAFRVELRLPTGTTLVSEAVFEFPHVSGPQRPLAVLRLTELAPEEVPPMTEVWRLTNPHASQLP